MNIVFQGDRTFIGESCETSLEFGCHVRHRVPALLIQNTRRSVGLAVFAAVARTKRRASASALPADQNANTNESSAE